MSRRGFTLVEVLVALLLAGVGVLTVHGLFGPVADGARRAARTRLDLDRAANARHVLGSTLMSVEVGPPPATLFEGHRNRMTFSAWIPTADGWFEIRPVTVQQDGDRMIVSWPGSRTVLRDSVALLQFDYLLESGLNARWAGVWISPVSPPVAVRVRSSRLSPSRQVVADTSLYPIGVGR
jgi:prepilin-type N-terminal cleavage/methylation domain-containing protein